MVPYTTKNPKSQWRRSRIFIVDFEHIIGGWERTCQFIFMLPVIFMLLNLFKNYFALQSCDRFVSVTG